MSSSTSLNKCVLDTSTDAPPLHVRRTLHIPCGQSYVLETSDGQLLETGDVFMSREPAYGTRPYRFNDFDAPSDRNKRVMTICSMAGCPMNCSFCACRQTMKRNLTHDEIVNQVETMRMVGIEHGRHDDLLDAQELRILYTRMGEPMLNVESVISSIRTLIGQYPHVIIGMSTAGLYKGVQKFIQAQDILPYLDMQFSLHSTCQNERQKLFGMNSKLFMNLNQIKEAIDVIFETTKKKVSLNMILFEGLTYDIEYLAKIFDSKKVWLRLSPWNYVEESDRAHGLKGLLQTNDVTHKKPLSSERLKTIISSIEHFGFSYAYAPAIDEEIKYNVACGQTFEAFKDLNVFSHRKN